MNEPTVVQVVPPQQVKNDKGAYVTLQVPFGGASQMRGFSYFTPEFKDSNDKEIDDSVTNMFSKYGKKVVIAVFNSALRAGLAVKARNEIAKIQNVPELDEEEKKDPAKVAAYNAKVKAVDPTIEALRQDPVKSILVPEDVADKWIPGERELTMQGALKKATDAYNRGDISEAQKWMKMVNELAAKMGINSNPSTPEPGPEIEEEETANA